jgi:hypothetical protein
VSIDIEIKDIDGNLIYCVSSVINQIIEEFLYYKYQNCEATKVNDGLTYVYRGKDLFGLSDKEQLANCMRMYGVGELCMLVDKVLETKYFVVFSVNY